MAAACPLLLSTAAPAQELQRFEPAQIERQVETAPPPATVPPTPRLPAGTDARVELSERTFTLAGVLVEGSTVYENLDFLPLYQSSLGREITVATLRELAEAITRRYHEDGWFLSSALVPAQDIESGVVRIRIVEGHIEDWRFTEGGAEDDPLVERMLRPVLAQRPVRRADLIAALRRINELPDLTVTPEVRSLPGRPGVYQLLLAAERKRGSGAVSVDNRGTELIGPVRAIALFDVFGMLGRHESLRLQLATAAETEELAYVDASVEWPLGANGLRAQAGTSHTRSRPGGDLEALDVRIANDRYRLGLMWPLSRAANSLSNLGAQIDAYRSRTDVLGERRLEDRLTTVQLNYRAVHAGGTGRVRALALSLTQGLAVGGSRVVDTQGTAVGEPEFTRANFNLTLRRDLREHWELGGALDGQYATRPLPSSERYSVGGAQFGRAYDPSEISGDHGLAARVELARKNVRAGDLARLSPYGFYDLGAVWGIGERRFERRISIASAGLGVRAAGARLSATLEVAQPLTRAVASEDSEDKRPRVFATASWRF